MRRVLKKAAAVVTMAAVLGSMAACTSGTNLVDDNKNAIIIDDGSKDEDKDGNVNDKNNRDDQKNSDSNAEYNKLAHNLMEGIKAKAVEANKDVASYGPAMTDFALRLFKANKDGNKDDQNMLVSPLSVLLALSMTANGADGDTLAQMEKVLGMSKDDLNMLAYTYMKLLTERDSNFGSLELANSIWFKDDAKFAVEQAFLQINSDYYGASLYKAPFDESTLSAINSWVNDKTHGMIPSIIDRIPEEAVMYLINALAFDAEWASPYMDYDIYDDEFTKANGDKINCTYMSGKENYYLEDKNAAGFIKHYKGYNYAFAAILPNEGVSVDEYLASLDGKKLTKMLTDKTSCEVLTKMPKFKTDYSVEMSGLLQGMGMKLAFDKDNADFKKLGAVEDQNIYINNVIHKTFIAVDENGTKAGAATAVGMMTTTSFGGEKPLPKEVYLTRPFIYMLIDCETNSPFFIGVMDCPEE